MDQGNSPFGMSWADQWDSDPAPAKKETSSKAKYGKKLGEGLEKTKAVASTGVKKVKEGTTLGFHWIKDKYNKRTQKR